MPKHEYDVIVIGSGPAGYVAAIRAAQLGLKTACVEKSPTLGGTCLNVGCIPSKALLQSSESFAWLRHAAQSHGIDCQNPSVNLDKMMQRKSTVVKSLVDGVAGLLKRNGITRVEGSAHFVSEHTLEISKDHPSAKDENKRQMTADHFIIATGSEAIPLPFLPFDEKVIVSSTGALSLTSIPKKMVVIGAGVIGLELASVYSRLGTEVTIVEMLESIATGMDAAISKTLLQTLKKQGIAFHLNTAVNKANKEADGYSVTIQPKNRSVDKPEANPEIKLSADVILVAIGRRAFTEGLGLKELAIKINSKGLVEVDGNFRTSVPHIFAIGDVIEGPMLAHRASEEGMAVAEIIAGKTPHINYLAIPNVIYTNPEVAAVGLSEQEARDLNLPIIIGECSFKANPRARCIGNTDGFVKVIGLATSGKLIGMHILGVHASEMIGEGVIALEKKSTLEEIANASHAHPTCSEAIKEACLAALGRAIHI